ncbi:MAG: hypothetical protein KDK41_00175 [Leptospiraceae bacterium]|nr:hypothetical protein [Leptospiraceae bacterium]
MGLKISKKRFTFTAALALLIVSGFLYAQAQERKFVQGVAVDAKTNKIAYYENHNEVYKDGSHIYSNVFYKSATGDLISKKYISFTKSRIAPDYIKNNVVTGGFESSTNLGNGKFLFKNQDSKEDSLEQKVVQISGTTVVDGGFDFFVRDNWQELMSGKKMIVNFAIPARLDYYSFRIYKSATSTHRGRPCAVITVDINSAVLRLVADGLTIKYDLETKRLLNYKGVSNIASNSGKNYVADISFDPKYYK